MDSAAPHPPPPPRSSTRQRLCRAVQEACRPDLAACALLLACAGLLQAQVDTPSTALRGFEQLWESGERRLALRQMTAAYEARPDDGELGLALAQRLLTVHMFEASRKQAARLGAKGAATHGRALYYLGRYAEALPLLSPLARSGQVSDALMHIDALEALGLTTQADTAAAQAVARHGDQHPALLSFLGRRAAARGNHLVALAHFEHALALDARNPEALYGQGQALLRCQRRQEGLAVLQRHRELVPLLDQRDHALRAVDLDPTHASNHAMLADAERALGRPELSLQLYERARVLAQPTEWVPIHLRYARALVEDFGRLDEAVALLEAADLRQADARLSVRAGDLLLAAGRRADAAAHYQVALQLRPTDAEILERMEAARAAPTDATEAQQP